MAIVDGVLYDAGDPANPVALCSVTVGAHFLSRTAVGATDGRSALSKTGDRVRIASCYFKGTQFYDGELLLSRASGAEVSLGSLKCENRGWSVRDHRALSFSPTGRFLLLLYTTLEVGQIRVFRSDDGTLAWSSESRERANGGEAFALWFPHEDRLLFAEGSGISTWDPTGAIRQITTTPLEDLTISPTADLFAGTNRSGPTWSGTVTRVEIRSLADGSLMGTQPPAHGSQPWFVTDAWIWFMKDQCPCPNQGGGYSAGAFHTGEIMAFDLKGAREIRLPMSLPPCRGSPTRSCPPLAEISDVWND